MFSRLHHLESLVKTHFIRDRYVSQLWSSSPKFVVNFFIVLWGNNVLVALSSTIIAYGFRMQYMCIFVGVPSWTSLFSRIHNCVQNPDWRIFSSYRPLALDLSLLIHIKGRAPKMSSAFIFQHLPQGIVFFKCIAYRWTLICCCKRCMRSKF